MSDLIDRDSAIVVACKQIKDDGIAFDVKEAIKALPTAERHGRWIKESIVLTSCPPQYQWHCSECGRIRHWFDNSVLADYCPNCGARMEGVEDEWSNYRRKTWQVD